MQKDIGTAIDAFGVFMVVIGGLLATSRFIFQTQGAGHRSYPVYRQDLGRAILLGLEFLVAGDIIRDGCRGAHLAECDRSRTHCADSNLPQHGVAA